MIPLEERLAPPCRISFSFYHDYVTPYVLCFVFSLEGYFAYPRLLILFFSPGLLSGLLL